MKRYSVLLTEDDDGTIKATSENDGFSAYDIIRFLRWKLDDVIDQAHGKIKPDIVERRYIEDTQNGDAGEGDAE
jgi:hypothetical protein